ncbi:MAG TPA: PilZ domain-containing protein [bacterium]|nr:PilZ domain-containing protein [bacterium]
MRVSIAERRKAPRVPVDFPVIYRTIRGEDSAIEEGVNSSKAKDISIYGIGIRATRRLEEGDLLHVRFYLDDREINGFCSVVWVDMEQGESEYYAGLEFDYIGETDAIRVIQYMKKKLGM